ncbi:MAG: hypothetical protein P1P89_13545 [Desulfobacterales bacterium]|nr:hypothetical protein [Desulfobacterales bacterium]
MRKKAEKKIREAAAMLGEDDSYRLDKVRINAGLYPKVFDKTILDMARLGTITLKEGKTDALSPAEIGNMVRKGETVYMYFSFQDETAEAPAEAETEIKTPETVDIELPGVDRAMWQQFERRCLDREGKPPLQKIMEMISEYNGCSDN